MSTYVYMMYGLSWLQSVFSILFDTNYVNMLNKQFKMLHDVMLYANQIITQTDNTI